MNELTLRKFKLVDREGYINAHPANEQLLAKHFVNGVSRGYTDTLGYFNDVVIAPDEFKFFEEIEEGE